MTIWPVKKEFLIDIWARTLKFDVSVGRFGACDSPAVSWLGELETVTDRQVRIKAIHSRLPAGGELECLFRDDV